MQANLPVFDGLAAGIKKISRHLAVRLTAGGADFGTCGTNGTDGTGVEHARPIPQTHIEAINSIANSKNMIKQMKVSHFVSFLFHRRFTGTSTVRNSPDLSRLVAFVARPRHCSADSLFEW